MLAAFVLGFAATFAVALFIVTAVVTVIRWRQTARDIVARRDRAIGGPK